LPNSLPRGGSNNRARLKGRTLTSVAGRHRPRSWSDRTAVSSKLIRRDKSTRRRGPPTRSPNWRAAPATSIRRRPPKRVAAARRSGSHAEWRTPIRAPSNWSPPDAWTSLRSSPTASTWRRRSTCSGPWPIALQDSAKS
jgi:hypothetical protein